MNYTDTGKSAPHLLKVQVEVEKGVSSSSPSCLLLRKGGHSFDIIASFELFDKNICRFPYLD